MAEKLTGEQIARIAQIFPAPRRLVEEEQQGPEVGLRTAERVGQKYGLSPEETRRVLYGGAAKDYEEFDKELQAFSEDRGFAQNPTRIAGQGRSLQSAAGLRSLNASRKGLKPSQRLQGLFLNASDPAAVEADRRRRGRFTIIGAAPRRTILTGNRTLGDELK